MKNLFKLCLIVCLVLIATGTDSIAGISTITATRGTVPDVVELNWSASRWATGYHVSKSCNYNGPYIPVAWSENGTYVDHDVERGKYYWYKVTPQYWLVPGASSKRVQGWVTPKVPGGMIEMSERTLKILEQVPHFYNVRGLVEKRMKTLPQPDISDLEIPDNNTIFKWIEKVCEPAHRRIGSPESHQSVAYIKNKLQESLNVAVHDDEIDLPAVYTAENWELLVQGEDGPYAFPAFYGVNTGITLESPYGGSVTSRMVWAGDGSVEAFAELEQKGLVEGNIIVAECEFPNLPVGIISTLFDGGYHLSDPEGLLDLLTSIPMIFTRSNFPAEYGDEQYDESVYWQAKMKGAVGLVLVMKNHPGDVNSHWGPYDGKMRSMPVMWVSSYRGAEISALAQAGETATITIEGTVEPGKGYNVYATLPGKSDEVILVTSHHDSCHKGATEDGTGVGMVLAQAEIWGKVPFKEREKTIVFLLTDGHHYAGIGAEHFSEHHMDDVMKKTIININLEHLAAKEIEVDENGKFAPTDRGAWTFMFMNENPTAIAAAVRALDDLKPDKTMAVHSTLLGDVPPGETGHFHIKGGVDFIHWIGQPMYLLSAEDTLDKVDQTMLNPIAEKVTEMVETFMLLPEGYSDYE